MEAATSLLLHAFNEVGTSLNTIAETTGTRPCLSHSTKCALRNRTQALRTFLDTGTAETRTEFLNRKETAKRMLKEDAQRQWKRRLEQLREAVGGRHNKRVWNWMNNFTKPNRRTSDEPLPSILDFNNVLQTSQQCKEAAWLAYYRRLFDDPTGHSRDPSWWAQFRPIQDPLDSLENLTRACFMFTSN